MNIHMIHGELYTMLDNGAFGGEGDLGIIHDGEIYIENGKITAVGRNLQVPHDAEIHDVKGSIIMPGLIDAHCHVGIVEDGLGEEGNDGNETTDPVTPELRAIDGINPACDAFAEGRESGVTTVATGPGSANTVGGQFAALKTYGRTIRDMIIKEPLAMKCAFGENPKRVYGGQGKKPKTRMANAALIRDLLSRTAEYVEKKKVAETNDDPSAVPAFDSKLEAMCLVLNRTIPLKAHAHRADDMLTAIRIAEEFSIDLTLDHCTEGHLISEELAASGRGLIVGPSFMFRSKPEVAQLTLKTPGILASAGAKIAIMTDLPSCPLSFLRVCVGLAVQGGLSMSDAYRSVTSNAAEILMLDDRIGTLAPGKDADIAVFSGNPFTDLMQRCLMTIIDGTIVWNTEE